jgi:hypothetical protein
LLPGASYDIHQTAGKVEGNVDTAGLLVVRRKCAACYNAYDWLVFLTKHCQAFGLGINTCLNFNRHNFAVNLFDKFNLGNTFAP